LSSSAGDKFKRGRSVFICDRARFGCYRHLRVDLCSHPEKAVDCGDGGNILYRVSGRISLQLPNTHFQ
jgi:hypothetical protein